MPFKNRDDFNAWRRKTYKQRRDEFFSDKNCVDCGSGIFLELDHVDPKEKVSHCIWIWGKEKREEEIAKCVVRCKTCHKTRHKENGGRWRQKVESERVSKHTLVENSGQSIQDQKISI